MNLCRARLKEMLRTLYVSAALVFAGFALPVLALCAPLIAQRPRQADDNWDIGYDDNDGGVDVD